MAWTLGGYRVIVYEESEKPEVRLSEHIVLDGTESIIHNFGFGSNTKTINAWLLNNPDDYPALASGYQNGTSFALVSDQGPQGNFKIWTLTKQRVNDIHRTKPVYKISLELKSA